MRLSDAIVCGSLMGGMKAHDINHCALGVAATAAGIPEIEFDPLYGRDLRYDLISDCWPWLGKPQCQGHMGEIMELFDLKVCKGLMTLDQLIAYVRQIEPSCPDCCSFDCCCARGEYLLEQMATASDPMKTFA